VSTSDEISLTLTKSTEVLHVYSTPTAANQTSLNIIFENVSLNVMDFAFNRSYSLDRTFVSFMINDFKVCYVIYMHD